MAKFLFWLLSTLSAIVLSAVFVPPLTTFLQKIGWHTKSVQLVLNTVNWLENIVGVDAFPWIVAGVLGAFIGAVLHHFAGKFDGRRILLRKKDLHNLGLRMIKRAEKIRGVETNYLSPNGIVPREDANTQLPEVHALFSVCRHIGLTTPELLTSDVEACLSIAEDFFRELGPLVREGELRNAITRSNELSCEYLKMGQPALDDALEKNLLTTN